MIDALRGHTAVSKYVKSMEEFYLAVLFILNAVFFSIIGSITIL